VLVVSILPLSTIFILDLELFVVVLVFLLDLELFVVVFVFLLDLELFVVVFVFLFPYKNWNAPFGFGNNNKKLPTILLVINQFSDKFVFPMLMIMMSIF
jgi:hypothetical protein